MSRERPKHRLSTIFSGFDPLVLVCSAFSATAVVGHFRCEGAEMKQLAFRSYKSEVQFFWSGRSRTDSFLVLCSRSKLGVQGGERERGEGGGGQLTNAPSHKSSVYWLRMAVSVAHRSFPPCCMLYVYFLARPFTQALLVRSIVDSIQGGDNPPKGIPTGAHSYGAVYALRLAGAI